MHVVCHAQCLYDQVGQTLCLSHLTINVQGLSTLWLSSGETLAKGVFRQYFGATQAPIRTAHAPPVRRARRSLRSGKSGGCGGCGSARIPECPARRLAPRRWRRTSARPPRRGRWSRCNRRHTARQCRERRCPRRNPSPWRRTPPDGLPSSRRGGRRQPWAWCDNSTGSTRKHGNIVRFANWGGNCSSSA